MLGWQHDCFEAVHIFTSFCWDGIEGDSALQQLQAAAQVRVLFPLTPTLPLRTHAAQAVGKAAAATVLLPLAIGVDLIILPGPQVLTYYTSWQ